ncbi:hypothetical protein [Polyangium mundeleinium]|uniref:Uncharacterized protein n=1 Tax=Polyangium mundeleinium TaxID=2995306 RepID=A0ABT5F0J2_9BACT|nr:hypothetical protein [Polyangium mundeleinium]MDC0747590.1 hypothetical protein [Polyangium mundeleinium]
MKCIVAMLGWTLVTLGFAAEAAAATPPPACRTEREQRFFRSGVQTGERLVRMAWGAVDREGEGCDLVQRFESDVLSNLDDLRLPPGSHRAVACQHVGIIAGAEEEAIRSLNRCVGRCCEEGSLIAKMKGQLYCDLSIAFGGLGEDQFFERLDVAICGGAFQTCCDSTYLSFTRAYRNAYGECIPYTRGRFISVWTQARRLSCAYPET